MESLAAQSEFQPGRSRSIAHLRSAFPAGTFEVETVEQALEAAGYTAHVRKSQTLIIRTATGLRCREIVASELDSALQRDTDLQLAEPSENPDREGVTAQ